MYNNNTFIYKVLQRAVQADEACMLHITHTVNRKVLSLTPCVSFIYAMFLPCYNHHTGAAQACLYSNDS